MGRESSLRLGVAAVALTIATASAAQQPSVQQQFESASAALAGQRWQDALSTFEALEKRVSKTPRSLAIVRVRKASALLALGREDEAESALRQG